MLTKKLIKQTEKLYKSNKYIEMHIKTSKIYIQTWRYTNIRKYMKKNIYLKL